jgi:hypothetical protein
VITGYYFTLGSPLLTDGAVSSQASVEKSIVKQQHVCHEKRRQQPSFLSEVFMLAVQSQTVHHETVPEKKTFKQVWQSTFFQSSFSTTLLNILLS